MPESEFKNHTITVVEDEKEYLFQNGDNLHLKMRFIIRDERLMVVGDCYDWIFYRKRPISLLLSCQNKPYFWGNCSSRESVFSAKKTQEAIKDYIEDLDDVAFEEVVWDEKTRVAVLYDLQAKVFENPQEVCNWLADVFEEPDYESVVYSWPKNFECFWTGLMAFQKQYWAEKEDKKQ